MEYKRCFKCGRLLPLNDFYEHPRMRDGHLNKCKDCAKADSILRYNIKAKSKEWCEAERARGREKYKRLNYKDRDFLKTRSICPQEANISHRLKRKGLYKNGVEAHHWNYNRPFSVFIIPIKLHKLLHKFMKVNYNNGFCYTEDGKKLETETKATSYFQSILSSNNIDYPLQCIDV